MEKYSNLSGTDRTKKNGIGRFLIITIAAIFSLFFGRANAEVSHFDADRPVASPELKIDFPVSGSLIRFFYSDNEGRDPDIDIYISKPTDTEGNMHFLGKIEPEGSAAHIESVFTQDVDGDSCKELLILARWEVSHPGLKTSGNFFRTYVYKASTNGNSFSRMELVEQRIGSGMEGTREGRKVHYPYRDAGSIRKLLNNKMRKQP